MLDVCGHLVPVVGPSGAGKDSILRAAREIVALDPRIVFPRRVVTRKAMDEAEDHDSMTDMAFAHAVADGEFALWWEAHSNTYGIPVSIHSDLEAGRTVVFNCSRAVLPEVMQRYPLVTAIEIAATPAILVERIVARGREDRDEAIVRVARKTSPYPAALPVIRIDNSGELQIAVNAFIASLRLLSRVSLPDSRELQRSPSLNLLTW